MAVRWKRVFLLTVVVLMAVIIFAPPVFAAPDSGQVSTAIESTWKTAATQIKTVTNNVIFPVVDCVLAILLFVKLAMAYFDYKKHGEFDFAPDNGEPAGRPVSSLNSEERFVITI